MPCHACAYQGPRAAGAKEGLQPRPQLPSHGVLGEVRWEVLCSACSSARQAAGNVSRLGSGPRQSALLSTAYRRRWHRRSVGQLQPDAWKGACARESSRFRWTSTEKVARTLEKHGVSHRQTDEAHGRGEGQHSEPRPGLALIDNPLAHGFRKCVHGPSAEHWDTPGSWGPSPPWDWGFCWSKGHSPLPLGTKGQVGGRGGVLTAGEGEPSAHHAPDGQTNRRDISSSTVIFNFVGALALLLQRGQQSPLLGGGSCTGVSRHRSRTFPSPERQRATRG